MYFKMLHISFSSFQTKLYKFYVIPNYRSTMDLSLGLAVKQYTCVLVLNYSIHEYTYLLVDATVYVGGLDDKVSEAILWELFLQAGPVGKCHQINANVIVPDR